MCAARPTFFPRPRTNRCRKMGTDAIFGPVKASVQAACGQRNDARVTMHNFKEGNPVALVARGAYHTARGRHDRGKELGKRGVKHTASIVNGVANATPVVGHAKAGYHYARKDKEAGHKAMKSASRSTAGLVGAAAGLTAGLGPGAVAGYMAGVSAADGAISGKCCIHGYQSLVVFCAFLRLSEPDRANRLATICPRPCGSTNVSKWARRRPHTLRQGSMKPKGSSPGSQRLHFRNAS